VINAELQVFHNWVFRYRSATIRPSRLLVMLHGWTGDEDSMWVFARTLPAHVAVLAPRGPNVIPDGGFSWSEKNPESLELPAVDNFRKSADALIDFVDEWSKTVGVSSDQIDLIGFSQGAALAYVLTIFHPEKIRALAALSGFLPAGMEKMLVERPLKGKPVYVAHGRQDELIPVEKARKAVELLKSAGAEVTYCESEGGHKVSVSCFSELEVMFG